MSQAPQFIVFRGLEFREPNTNEMLAKLHVSVSTWKHMEHMAHGSTWPPSLHMAGLD